MSETMLTPEQHDELLGKKLDDLRAVIHWAEREISVQLGDAMEKYDDENDRESFADSAEYIISELELDWNLYKRYSAKRKERKK